MRKLLAALAVFASCTALTSFAAQAPIRLNYQGKLLDSSNNPRTGSVSMEFRLFDAVSGGNLLWGPETNAPTLTNGVFSVLLGNSVSLTPDMLANGPVFLSVTAAPDTFPGGEMSPRQQLAMTAYAVTANQLSSSVHTRVNSGIAYSTFTTGGNWLMPYGLSVTTITASSGTFNATTTPAVTASSNVLVTGGMLEVTSPSGISNEFGIITATLNVVSPAATTSINASSNVVLAAGMLTAPQIKGDASWTTGSAPLVAHSSGSAAFTMTAGVGNERVLSYSTITITNANKNILIFGTFVVGNVNTAGSCIHRVYRASAVNTACLGTGSGTLLYAQRVGIVNSAASQPISSVVAMDNGPLSAGTWSYCQALACTAAYVVSGRTLTLMEVDVGSTSGIAP